MNAKVIIAVCVALAPSLAAASEWSHTQEFQTTAQATTSVRVLEPEGYKVTIAGKTETIPTVITVENADNYVPVKVVAPDGATWEKRLEVKAYRQAVVKVRHVPSKSAAARRSFIGIVSNLTHNCDASSQQPVRFDFVLDKVVGSVTLRPNQRADMELAQGTYDVRRYRVTKSGDWAFVETSSTVVEKDGWKFWYGCR